MISAYTFIAQKSNLTCLTFAFGLVVFGEVEAAIGFLENIETAAQGDLPSVFDADEVD